VLNSIRAAAHVPSDNPEYLVYSVRAERAESDFVRLTIMNTAMREDAMAYSQEDEHRPGHHTGGVGIAFLGELSRLLRIPFRRTSVPIEGTASLYTVTAQWEIQRQ
jgi:hypothetical protein